MTAFGITDNVIDLGAGHFLRPIHDLVRRDEPIGTPIRPHGDSPVIGFMLWHSCATVDDTSWRQVFPTHGASPIVECPICGDRGHVVNGAWMKA